MDSAVIYQGGILVPANDYAAIDLEKMFKGKQGAMVGVKFIVHRNYGNHKRLFSFINAVFDMQEFYETVEVLRQYLLIRVGHMTTVISHNGNTTYIPKSISYEELPEEADFNDLFKSIRDGAFSLLHELGYQLTSEQFDNLTSYDG